MRHRMRDESGASIIFALLFFLLASITGIIILTAAFTTSGQLNGLRENQEARYSARSAAQTLGQVLEGTTCMLDESGANIQATCTLSPAMGSTSASSGAGAGGWVSSMPQLIAKLVADTAASGTLVASSATLSANVSSEHLTAVSVKMTIDTLYNIELECTAGDTTVTCTLPAATDAVTPTATPTKIMWMEPVISRPSVAVNAAGGA